VLFLKLGDQNCKFVKLGGPKMHFSLTKIILLLMKIIEGMHKKS